MKKVLIIPKNLSGIIDVRKTDYLTLDNVSFLEDITQQMMQNAKSIADYKFCQFEMDETIPIAFKVVDKISGNALSEFSIDRITFKDIDLDDSDKLIEDKYLQPIKAERQVLLQSVLELVVLEKIGQEVKQSEYDSLKESFDKIEKKIKDFRHVHYNKKQI